MKSIIFIFISCVLSISNAFAGKFESTCKEIDGRVTDSSSITCRSVGETVNASVHKDHNGEIFAMAYIDGPVLNEEATIYIKKLAKGMGIEFPADFFDVIKNRKFGERVGFTYDNMTIYWRTASEKGAFDYSGFVIYEDSQNPPENSIRCYATGCKGMDVAKWYGPIKGTRNKAGK